MTDDDWNRIRNELTRAMGRPDSRVRYPSIDFLIHDLRRLLNGEPIQRRQGPPKVGARDTTMMMGGIVAGIVGTTLLGMVLYLLPMQGREEQRAAELAAVQARHSQEIAILTGRVNSRGSVPAQHLETMADLFLRNSPLDPNAPIDERFWQAFDNVSGAMVMSYLPPDLGDPAVREVNRILEQMSLARWQVPAGAIDRAVAEFAEASESSRTLADEIGEVSTTHILLAIAQGGRGAALAEGDDLDAAKTQFAEAAETFRRAIPRWDPARQRVLVHLFTAMLAWDAALAERSGRIDEAVAILEEAVGLLEDLPNNALDQELIEVYQEQHDELIESSLETQSPQETSASTQGVPGPP